MLSSSSHDDRIKTPLPKPQLRPAAELADPVWGEQEDAAAFLGRAYTTSKLCILMFAYKLDRRLKAQGRADITVNALDPGGMLTGMVSEWPPAVRMMMKLLWPVLRLAPNASTPQASAKVLAEMVTSENYRNISGRYFSMIGSYRRGAKEKQTSPISYDNRAASQLWAESEQLTMK
ncbi:hypothetical protein AWM70_03190 [Paenibacillus yonginensis]|uniref:Short-chain dehydrogenase n=1 Tax=Paenibacillus yonginensis TaxID=1462996 RepID=A0A1B1MWZ3_9BACL|nr:hypothetical protein [Paenibacillus yonginensis]ANS73700.1 hypothetical protein AWM70_03190 [Paenibacillus yonginensis]